MRISSDKQDKLHGCLEHLFNQVSSGLRLGLIASFIWKFCIPKSGSFIFPVTSFSSSIQSSSSHTRTDWLTVCVCFIPCPQVDSINCLLKGAVMSKACEETKHFYSDHTQPGTYACPCVSSCHVDGVPQQMHALTRSLLNRVPTNRRLDGSLSPHHPQEHPGGPLEPPQLHQNPGGEPAEIRGRLAQTHTHMAHGARDSCSFNSKVILFSFCPHRWKEPASPGSAEVHR